jgi:hypothetical protein
LSHYCYRIALNVANVALKDLLVRVVAGTGVPVIVEHAAHGTPAAVVDQALEVVVLKNLEDVRLSH